MEVWILEHNGMWIGGAIVVAAPSINKASEIIISELESSGVEPKDYDIGKIKMVDRLTCNVALIQNGDY